MNVSDYIVIKIRCQATAVDNRNASEWLEVDVQPHDTGSGEYVTVLLEKGKLPSFVFKRKKVACTIDMTEIERSLQSNFKIKLNEYL
jgi:hypothetical protein